ncbi:cytochrome c biogenesis protein CcmG, thiol:disulfide interchange protein DsbE [Pararobbsia alpina]|uniref:TlpA family protein disulfide reductase n=1 Tax=Pararobbsia alpina TaxID=621374 RepID=UPI0039A5D6F2
MDLRKLLVRCAGGAVIALAGIGIVEHSMARSSATETVRLNDISLQSVSGATETLGRYAGKVVIVNFWAPWCAPCRREVPDFVALQQKYGDKVQFVGVALDDPEPVASFSKQYGMNYPLYLAGNAGVALMLREGDTRGVVPYTLVIDGQGTKIASTAGQVDKDRLDALLAQLTSQGH